MRSEYEVIKRPVVSEKSTFLSEEQGRYVFEVALAATKTEIKDAVQRVFKVKVKQVNTAVMHGEFKQRGRVVKKKRNWKKAVVTLQKGQRIDLFQTQ